MIDSSRRSFVLGAGCVAAASICALPRRSNARDRATPVEAPPNVRPLIDRERKNILAIPIQALTVRTKGDLDTSLNKPVNPDAATIKANNEEVTGVFVVTADNKSPFRKVETGISGATDIEVISGLAEGDQIVTGPYQVIRTIKNGAIVKIDNKPATPKPTT